MKIHFGDSAGKKPDLCSGVMSFIPWEDPELQDGLRKVFNERSWEKITDLWVGHGGITAIFEIHNRAALERAGPGSMTNPNP